MSAMNEGRLSQEALRGWVANRFYYQRNIPIKDAAILSNCPLREVRRIWIHRILDHDGTGENEGGIEAWLRLGEACGLSRDELAAESTSATWSSFRRRCLCEFRSNSAVADRRCIIAHGTFRARSNGGATRGVRKILFAGSIRAALITSVAESPRRDATLMKRSRLRWTIATRLSCSARRCARSSLNAMCCGPCSMRSITLTVLLECKLPRSLALRSQGSPAESGCKPIPRPATASCFFRKASSN